MTTDQTREFPTPAELAKDVRRILAGYVRLKVSERRRFLWFGTVFSVSGPAETLERAAEEIRDLQYGHWLDMQP
jgi:hypothetical protein